MDFFCPRIFLQGGGISSEGTKARRGVDLDGVEFILGTRVELVFDWSLPRKKALWHECLGKKILGVKPLTIKAGAGIELRFRPERPEAI